MFCFHIWSYFATLTKSRRKEFNLRPVVLNVSQSDCLPLNLKKNVKKLPCIYCDIGVFCFRANQVSKELTFLLFLK